MKIMQPVSNPGNLFAPDITRDGNSRNDVLFRGVESRGGSLKVGS